DLLAGLSKFAKLARSVTRSKTLVSQFSSHPVSIKDSTRHVQSHLAHRGVHTRRSLIIISPIVEPPNRDQQKRLLYPDTVEGD
ncbi:potassium voltage-gated channel protein eag-like isoform X3, partial [Aphis craccivora]